jgi:hypothetical protein
MSEYRIECVGCGAYEYSVDDDTHLCGSCSPAATISLPTAEDIDAVTHTLAPAYVTESEWFEAWRQEALSRVAF